MKIVCPHCQAAYQVDIPGLKTKDVDVKCARCKSKFVVKKHGSDEEQNSPEQTVESLAGGAISEVLAESASERTLSRWSGEPSSTLTAQVPQVPERQE